MEAEQKIYRVSGWRKTFETADSRRHGRLSWVSVPIGLNSNGFLTLVDEFEDDAPAIYGAWIAMVMIAAECHDRGTLATSRGVGLTSRRLSRLSHFPSEAFDRLIAWASREEVGWLEEIDPESLKNEADQSSNDQQSIDDRATRPDQTSPNQTKPNITQPDQTRADSADRSGKVKTFESDLDWDSDEVRKKYRARSCDIYNARKLSTDAEKQLIVQVGFLSMHMSHDWYVRMMRDWRGDEIRNPKKWMEGVALNACEEMNWDWEELRKAAPKWDGKT